VADNASLCWWTPDKLDDAERALLAVRAHKAICDLPTESFRRDKDLFNVRLYENNPSVSLYTFAGNYYSEATTLALPPGEQSTNNKAKAAIDTLASQIASTEQRARFRVIDGTYRQRRRSRELQNFADGLAGELELQRWKQRAFFDGAILESGVGAIQLFEKDKRCAAKRILATSISIDPMDGLTDGYPRRLYVRAPIPRDEVLALWGDRGPAVREAIKNAPNVISGGAPADHIEVFEQWCLPSGDGTKDGWHVVALETQGGDLVVEQFTRRRHDIVFFALEDKFTTAWGRSLMSQMRALQLRINANGYRIERAQRLFCSGHIYVDRAAQMNKQSMTNELGSIWEGNGPQAPQQILYNAAPAELYKQIEDDGKAIFDNNGINVGASTGSTSLGANAPAEAIREETTKSDKRNSVRQQAYEHFHIELMKTALGIVRDIVGSGKSGYKVASKGKRGLSRVDWKDAAMDEKDYVIEIKPASPTPTDPAGLVAHGERMIELGVWKPSDLQGYLQDLDSEGRTNRQLSQQRNLEKTFENLLYEPRGAAQPDEFTNYQLALEIGAEYLAQGEEEDEVPEKHLDRVRRYLKKCKALDAKAKAAAAPPAPPPSNGVSANAPATPSPEGEPVAA
jgi:hypothetical protein